MPPACRHAAGLLPVTAATPAKRAPARGRKGGRGPVPPAPISAGNCWA